MKDKSLKIRINNNDIQELKEISKIIDVPYSQVAREAIREKIAVLKKTDPRLKDVPVLEAA